MAQKVIKLSRAITPEEMLTRLSQANLSAGVPVVQTQRIGNIPVLVFPLIDQKMTERLIFQPYCGSYNKTTGIWENADKWVLMIGGAVTNEDLGKAAARSAVVGGLGLGAISGIFDMLNPNKKKLKEQFKSMCSEIEALKL